MRIQPGDRVVSTPEVEARHGQHMAAASGGTFKLEYVDYPQGTVEVEVCVDCTLTIYRCMHTKCVWRPVANGEALFCQMCGMDCT